MREGSQHTRARVEGRRKEAHRTKALQPPLCTAQIIWLRFWRSIGPCWVSAARFDAVSGRKEGGREWWWRTDEEPVETGVRELFGNGGRVRVDEEADLRHAPRLTRGAAARGVWRTWEEPTRCSEWKHLRLSAQHLALEFLAGQLLRARRVGRCACQAQGSSTRCKSRMCQSRMRARSKQIGNARQRTQSRGRARQQRRSKHRHRRRPRRP